MRIRNLVTQVIWMTTITSATVSANLQAAFVILDVNSAASSLTLAGEVGGVGVPPTPGGVAYAQQSPGSLVANWGGTIQADFEAGVFSFAPGGSAIRALVNPNGPFTAAPHPNGIEAGNYGTTVNGPIPAAGGTELTINGVYRDLVLDITSGTAQNGLALVGANMRFTSGTLDFGIFPQIAAPDSNSMIGNQGANTSNALVTWDGTTLTIPVAFQTTGGTGRIENWSGTIVATVPEPSSTTVLISLLGMFGVCCRTRRT